MAKVLYDFLTESLLFDSNYIERKYEGVSTDILQKELEKYREYSIAQSSNIFGQIIQTNNKIPVTKEGFNSFLPMNLY